MRHFVHGPDGQKYGPADMPLLHAWKAEGRITPETLIEPEVGGTPMVAKAMPELFPELQERQAYGQSQWSDAPVKPVAPVLTEEEMARRYANWTWILGPVALLCCPLPAGIAALICAVNASKRGHPQGTTLVIYAMVSMALGLALGVYTLKQMGGWPTSLK
ncbi:MAG: hypothetical protein JSS66_10705 [Armatimonadetes bacterium]|nr:hypothetical protein [Armatimonadota bacterium]